jgi:hypothetical protein
MPKNFWLPDTAIEEIFPDFHFLNTNRRPTPNRGPVITPACHLNNISCSGACQVNNTLSHTLHFDA